MPSIVKTEYHFTCSGHTICVSRFYLGVSKLTPNSAVQGDMGWKRSWHRQKIYVVHLWVRLINMNVNRQASKIFWYIHGLALSNCKTWCHLTLKMFDNDELAHLREADNSVSKGAEEANAHFTKETISTWENNLNRTVRVGNNKLRTHRTFKSDFETEMYLKKPIPFKVRQSFVILRWLTHVVSH